MASVLGQIADQLDIEFSEELSPTEQARIVALVVERIDIGTEGINVRLRIDGIRQLSDEAGAS